MIEIIAFTFLVLPLLLAQPLFAQSSLSVVPVEKEPLHRVVFQNKRIRLIDAEISPGDVTLFHTHSFDNVYIVASGGNGMDERANAMPIPYHVYTGLVGYNEGKAAPYTHRCHNIGKTILRFIAAEIVGEPIFTELPSSLENLAGYRLEMENERVKVYRRFVSPNQSTEVRSRKLSWLRVSLSETELLIDAPGKDPKHIKTKTGDFRWHDGPTIESLRNVGKTPYEAIEIEVK